MEYNQPPPRIKPILGPCCQRMHTHVNDTAFEIKVSLSMRIIDWLIDWFYSVKQQYNLQYKNTVLIDKLNSYTDCTIQLKQNVVNTRITHESRKTTYFQWGP